MTELTKENKISIGVAIAVILVVVIIVIVIIVIIIKPKKTATEETKEGFETGKETIPTIILNAFMNSVLTKDVRNLSSKVTNTTIFAIERAINKARKDLDTAIETFKKNCAAKGIKDYNKAVGVQRLMVLAEKNTVTSKYNMVVSLYKALGNVISKVDKGKTTITEVMVPEMNFSATNTTTAKPDSKLTIEPAIKSYIMSNCNFMEVPKYKYVQASLGQKRIVNGKGETIWHESSYKYKPKLEEDVQPLLKKVETEVGVAQPIIEEVKPQVIKAENVSKIEEVKPVVNEIKIAEAKPVVGELIAIKEEEAEPIVKLEEVKPVVSNYVEPIRVAETNIIEAKVENPKADTVQAAVVNNYVTSKAESICTTNEQEIKFLKALRSLK